VRKSFESVASSTCVNDVPEQAEKAARANLDPRHMFRDLPEYSKFDDDGK
jgi:hypothetical protein